MAAITPSTDLYLLKAPLGLNNENQLTFATATAQYNYFYGLPKVGADNFTYQRHDSVIRYPAHIDSIIEYNYVMYRNDEYSSKWFYAYIKSMRYVNDNMTEITIEQDYWQTWQFNVTLKPSFVEREHVADDTIGKHTVPENIETGEPDIVSVNYIPFSDEVNDWYTCFVATKLPYSTAPWSADYLDIGGVFTPLYIFAVNCDGGDFTNAKKVIDLYNKTSDVTADAIINVYPIPADLIPTGQGASESWAKDGVSVTVNYVKNSYGSANSTTIAQDEKLSGNYTPRNRKLYTYPFSYFHISNNCGIDAEYRWEEFPIAANGRPAASYKKILVPTASMSGKIFFDNIKNYSGSAYGSKLYAYGVPFGKSPVCGWKTDYYTNWLTQNGLNIGVSTAAGVIGGLATAGVALATGGAGAVVAGGLAAAGLSAANAVTQVTQAQRTPDQAKGDVNSSDVMFAYFRCNMNIYKMSIKPEYARVVDGYFDQYGYKVNELKTPNINSRTYWNYIKTIGCNLIANIPQDDAQKIKDMFDTGVTFWHNTSHFLDYSQNNAIVTP